MTSTPPAGDQVGRIEVRGIDVIPAAERHGRARELFAVWAASNVTYLYVVLGGTLVVLGLSAWQAMAVVVAGNLFWAPVGVLSISGPGSGTPSSVVMRSMFGVRANRINVAVTGWIVCVAYEAINLAAGALAGFALAGEFGFTVGTGSKLVIVLVIAVFTLAISVYGHATIVRLSGPFAILLTVCFVVTAVFVVRHADIGYVPANGPSGGAWWAAALGGLTIIASGPLSWGTAADYSRYLPASTSSRSVALWTAFGGFVPSVLLGGLGVLAGTAIDMTNAQDAFRTILPAWFYPVFLVFIIVGTITNNILTAYSSGLSLQAAGIRWSRAVTVLFDGAVGVALTLYALLISNFLDTLNNVLELSVTVLGPSIAIYAADVVLRRNAYDGVALHDEAPGSPFWYHRGVNWAGVTAQLLGTALAVLCANTALVTGPIAGALGGADLSALVGPFAGASIYCAMTLPARRRAPASVLSLSAFPGGSSSVH